MLEFDRMWTVLSGHEQKIWVEIEPLSAVATEERARTYRQLPRRQTGRLRGLDEMAVGGVSIAVMLVFVGAPVTGFGVGAATASGWLLIRLLPAIARWKRTERIARDRNEVMGVGSNSTRRKEGAEMNSVTANWRRRREAARTRRALDRALALSSSPSMRDELLTMANGGGVPPR
jgi:hypothetical protein